MYVAVVHMADTSKGYFLISSNGMTIAEMEFSIQNTFLIVSPICKIDHSVAHSETTLFNAMVEYARKNYLIVVPNDAYVSQSLTENSELYEDIFYQS